MPESKILYACFSIVLIQLTLWVQVSGINQPCSSDLNCLVNSFCGFKKYCVCKDNYIMQCDITSKNLSPNAVTATISQSYSYFTISPEVLYEYIKFEILMSTSSATSKSVIATIWGQSGLLTQLVQANKLMEIQFNISSLSVQSIQTTYFQFGLQQNGQYQVLYMGLRINSNLADTMQMSISVLQEKAYNQDTFKLVLTVLMGVLSVSCLVLIAFCIYKKRRMRQMRQRAEQEKSVKSTSHFDQYMPVVNANRVKVPLQVCSVCLTDITLQNLVRLTICRHLFHSECIDSWCKKSTSCPICRQELDLQSCQKILGDGLDLSSSRSMKENVQIHAKQVELIRRRPKITKLTHVGQYEEVVEQNSMRRNMI